MKLFAISRLLPFIACLITIGSAHDARADIKNWQTNQTIPGTQGIVPGPGLSLQNWNTPTHNLEYADLGGGIDLTGSRFDGSLLNAARFTNDNLTNVNFFNGTVPAADFTGANLSYASLGYADIIGADFTNAIVTGASLDSEASYLTAQQLYSTASYKNHDLSGVALVHNNVSGWDFTGQNLTGAGFGKANVSLADFRGAIGFTGSYQNGNAILPDGSVHGLNVPSGQALVIRDYPLGISVQTSMSLTSTSSLNMQFASTSWGSTMSLAPGVVPSLAGSLDLLLAPGVDRNSLVGTTYHLFNWNGQLPAGSHFDQIVSLPGFVWDTSALYTTGDVKLLATPEPASSVLAAFGALAPFLARALRSRTRSS